MRKSSWVILGIIVVLCGLAIYLKVASLPRLSDEEQIHILLNDAQSAVERRDIDGVMGCIARDYKDGAGNNFYDIRRLAFEAFRGYHNSEKFVLSLENTEISVDGNHAVVQFDISLGMLDQSSGSTSDVFSKSMRLELRKEARRHWLVFPVDEWKITSISNVPRGGLGDFGE
jgi:hypothetical protein